MRINQPTTNLNFQAKFLHSKSLESIAKFSVRCNMFGKLSRMKNNIDKAHLKTRLLVDAGRTSDGYAQVTFTRFYPKYKTFIAKTMNDLRVVKSITYISDKKDNPIWFAMNKIIEMGQKAPYNELFKEIVAKK